MQRARSPRNFRPYYWLLVVAVLGFIFLPSGHAGGLAGGRLQLGWPLPTMVLQLTAISRDNPARLYPNFTLNSILVSLLNVALWLGVLYGLRYLVDKFRVPDGTFYLGVVIIFCTSLAVCILGGVSFLAAMITG